MSGVRVADVVATRLEERRKVKGKAYYDQKKAHLRQRTEAQKNAAVDEKTKAKLLELGYGL